MSIELPSRASAVVIGGGVTGSSVAYHLARMGWSDVVQLERSQFSCGTTWHAAGLIGTMRANENHARLAEYSMSILRELEQETGQSTGFRQVGSLSIAHSEARLEELKRVASMNNAFGVTRVDMLTPADIAGLYPLLETGDLLGGSWVPHDGFRQSRRRDHGIRQRSPRSRGAVHRGGAGGGRGHQRWQGDRSQDLAGGYPM